MLCFQAQSTAMRIDNTQFSLITGFRHCVSCIELDTRFVSVDFKTDAALRRALAQETKGRTTLIVAQRVSTIINADQIIVLEDGKIVGKGTHKELLKTCKVYEEIARSQLSEEEIAQ